MPVPHVNVQNGNVVDGPLTNGCNFKWTNTTSAAVQLTNCGGFCTASSFTVPAKSGSTNGTADAQILADPTGYTFTDPAWNAPGTPRIVVEPWPTAEHETHSHEKHAHEHHPSHKKEVA